MAEKVISKMIQKNTPVCATCARAYRPKQVGVWLLELRGNEPYRLWSVDKYACPQCGNTVLTGFAQRPLEHYEPSFAETLANAILEKKCYLERDHLTRSDLTLGMILEELRGKQE